MESIFAPFGLPNKRDFEPYVLVQIASGTIYCACVKCKYQRYVDMCWLLNKNMVTTYELEAAQNYITAWILAQHPRLNDFLPVPGENATQYEVHRHRHRVEEALPDPMQVEFIPNMLLKLPKPPESAILETEEFLRQCAQKFMADQAIKGLSFIQEAMSGTPGEIVPWEGGACPVCGVTAQDGALHDGMGAPEPGNWIVCGKCGEVLRLADDKSLNLLTLEDRMDLEDSEYSDEIWEFSRSLKREWKSRVLAQREAGK